MCTVLGKLQIRYVYTVLRLILVLRYVYLAGHTGG